MSTAEAGPNLLVRAVAALLVLAVVALVVFVGVRISRRRAARSHDRQPGSSGPQS